MKAKVEPVKKESKFFTFPERINNITIFVIVVLYTMVCITVTIFTAPKKTYTVIPSEKDYAHLNDVSALSGEDMSVTAKIYTSNINYNSTDKKFVPTYNSYLYVYSVNRKLILNFQSELSSLSMEDKMEYYTEQTSNNSSGTTVYNQYYTSIVGPVKQIFVSSKYHVDTDSASQQTERKYAFSEKMIKLTAREALSNKFTNQTTYTNLLRFTITATENESRHSIVTNVYIDSALRNYHLDFQTFILSEDNEVFDLVGWYNRTAGSSTNLSHTNSGTSIDLKIKYIIAKGYIYTESGTTEILYRVKYSDLV